ncbi:MAG: HAD-IIB family hydrolase [Patescibacteria group bacterium]|nr:HAD-IIB family hydrolase [Patescibacteria group bacterium]
MDFKPKLMAFDLDGTLAESKQRVSAEMGELLARLMQKMPAAVMSGAAFHQFENQFLPALPSDAHLENLYLFPTNAAACYQFAGSWSTIYDQSFTPEERGRVLQVLEESLKETGLDAPPPQVWGERIEDRGAQITFSALGQKAPIEEKQKWDPTREKRKPVYDLLVARLPEFSIGLNAMTSIDITRKGITKAYGIRQLVKLTGISVDEMLYVGDALEEGGNDYVVVETGVRTREVFGPEETARIIEQVLSQRLQPAQ